MSGVTLDVIRRRLSPGEPRDDGLRTAAVSVIVRSEVRPSVLLIKRSEHEGDPWSGQIAFPGGKMQPGDATARATAVRESIEEVGIDLEGSSKFMGYSEGFRTHTGTMNVVPSVFLLDREVEVKPNQEVSSYRWVGVEKLMAPSAKTTHRMEFGGRKVEMPAVLVGDYVVWGLTYRIVASLLW